MSRWTESIGITTVRDVASNQDLLRRRRYGVIEAANGKFVKIQLKPWPKIASLMEAHWIRGMKSKRVQKDVCRIYFNQAIGHSNYLTLAYGESSLNSTLRTLFAAMDVLNQIAYIKRSDAILAEFTNPRISDRFLKRRDWEQYMEDQPKRHWIKRFYGTYPPYATKFLKSKQGEMAPNASSSLPSK